MWDKVVKEIKDNKPSSIDIELNGIERVGFAVGLNKAIEIIEKYRKEKKKMNNVSNCAGEKLIVAIKNMTIVKENRPNTGFDFHGGFEELYLYKFKKYQSSVGRYIRNKKLKEGIYNG